MLLLGFFKNFVMEKDGCYNNFINLKCCGIVLLVDLICVYVFVVGLCVKNLFECLDDVIEVGLFL